ncbi:Asp23/Gls24 family envelope stress response protein [Furfurilactobacillus sp. WILCCON 0119]|uniref:Asp23/Gls24 family envelope stress response protein n=1 Tax=Furfurilactobacillus entadae TaxID=2922307 RepID=UPI0035F0CE9E
MAEAVTKKEIIFNNDVLEKIAGKTAQEVDGVLELTGTIFDSLSNQFGVTNPGQGVSADIDEDKQTVELELEGTLEYGKDANDIFDKITRKITAAVRAMTGYTVTSIKFHVKDLLTADEWRAQQNDDQSKK